MNRQLGWLMVLFCGSVFACASTKSATKSGYFEHRNDVGLVIARGRYVSGVKHGAWEEKIDGYWHKGEYVWGERQGTWRVVYYYENEEHVRAIGPYVDGQKHGLWAEHWRGEWPLSNRYFLKGPYVHGVKHGRWVGRTEHGHSTIEGPFADGKMHGI